MVDHQMSDLSRVRGNQKVILSILLSERIGDDSEVPDGAEVAIAVNCDWLFQISVALRVLKNEDGPHGSMCRRCYDSLE